MFRSSKFVMLNLFQHLMCHPERPDPSQGVEGSVDAARFRNKFGMTGVMLAWALIVMLVPIGVHADDVPVVADPTIVPTAPPVSPTVFISELAWAGSSISTSDEWLELENPGDGRIDLTGWSVWDVAATPPKLMLTIAAGQIGAHGNFLIANNGPDHAFSAGTSVLNVEPDVINSDVSLSNSALKLELRDAAGTVIDTVGNGRAGFHRDTTTPKAMIRLAPIADGTITTSWVLASEKRGLDAAAPDFGTPTPSGRPVITLPAVCRLVSHLGTEQPLSGIQVSGTTLTDPRTVLEVRLDATTLSFDAVPTPSGLDLTTRSVPTVLADQYELSVSVTDAGGLTSVASMPCDRLKTGTPIEISELAASPETDGQEFVELYNPGSTRAELYGWTLDDVDTGGSTLYTIDYPLIVEPGAYVALWGNETKLTFNNSGDDVQLFDPIGTRIDLVRFKGDEKGLSWNRGTPWYWTTPSPGRVNNAQPEIEPLAQGGSPIDDDVLAVSLSLATIVTDKANLVGAKVTTEGTIAVTQVPYDKRRVLLADGASSLELQVPEDVTLSLSVGDRVRVTGTVSRSNLPRILIEGMESVTVLERRDRPVVTWSTTQVPALLQLASVEGTVTKGGVSLELRSGERTVKTTRRSGVSFPGNEVGDTLRVIGVLTSLEPLTIRVLDEADVTLVATLSKPETAESTEPEAVAIPEEVSQTVATESPKEVAVKASVVQIELPNPARLVPVALIADQLIELAIILTTRQEAVGRITPLLAGASSTAVPRTAAVIALLLCLGSSFALLSLGGDLLWNYLIRRVNGP